MVTPDGFPFAYCLHVALKSMLSSKAPGLTPRGVLEKLGAIRMLDVYFPTTDGRDLVFVRHTQPETDQRLVLDPTFVTLFA